MLRLRRFGGLRRPSSNLKPMCCWVSPHERMPADGLFHSVRTRFEEAAYSRCHPCSHVCQVKKSVKFGALGDMQRDIDIVKKNQADLVQALKMANVPVPQELVRGQASHNEKPGSCADAQGTLCHVCDFTSCF